MLSNHQFKPQDRQFFEKQQILDFLICGGCWAFGGGLHITWQEYWMTLFGDCVFNYCDPKGLPWLARLNLSYFINPNINFWKTRCFTEQHGFVHCAAKSYGQMYCWIANMRLMWSVMRIRLPVFWTQYNTACSRPTISYTPISVGYSCKYKMMV